MDHQFYTVFWTQVFILARFLQGFLQMQIPICKKTKDCLNFFSKSACFFVTKYVFYNGFCKSIAAFEKNVRQYCVLAFPKATKGGDPYRSQNHSLLYLKLKKDLSSLNRSLLLDFWIGFGPMSFRNAGSCLPWRRKQGFKLNACAVASSARKGRG